MSYLAVIWLQKDTKILYAKKGFDLAYKSQNQHLLEKFLKPLKKLSHFMNQRKFVIICDNFK